MEEKDSEITKRTDTEIHNIELLLTLDYLLRYTDIDHPANQIKICERANGFGLFYKYDKREVKGNVVRHDRVGKCLKFLYTVSKKHPNAFPFFLKKTPSGKYYIEKRNGLDESQVAKILAAIKNDKYTRNEDVGDLFEGVFGAFSTSKAHREIIEKEYKRLIRGVKKYSGDALRKINLIEKAYHDGKIIQYRIRVLDQEKKKYIDYLYWCRVYLIQEFHRTLHALLLPVGFINNGEKYGRPKWFTEIPGFFEPIETMDIPNGEEGDILITDYDDNRDFEKWFKENFPKLATKYGTLDKMIQKKILLSKRDTSIVSFKFNLGVKDILKRSYEEFFSQDFRYQEVNGSEPTKDEITRSKEEVEYFSRFISSNSKEKEPQKYGTVKISVDEKSFRSWLLSDPNYDGMVCISDMITIIEPDFLNEDLALYFFKKFSKRIKYLDDNGKSRLLDYIETQY